MHTTNATNAQVPQTEWSNKQYFQHPGLRIYKSP